jgi:hypothetical protein
MHSLCRGWEKHNRHSDPFTSETAPFLPEVAPKADSKSWGSCAVVGNSGILNTHLQGAEISAHDTIIRINQAPFLPHYYEAVGNRTDVRLLNRMLTEMYAGHYRDLIGRDPNATYIATRADTQYVPFHATRLPLSSSDPSSFLSSPSPRLPPICEAERVRVPHPTEHSRSWVGECRSGTPT